MSALTMPQWSSTTAPVITVSGVPSRAGGPGLAHRLADHLAAAEDDLVARLRAGAAVLLDLDQQVGVGEPDPVAGGRAVQRGVPAAVEQAHRGLPFSWRGGRAGLRRVPRRRSRPAIRRPARAGPARSGCRPARTRSTSRGMPGSNRTDVPAGTASRCPQAAARSKSSAAFASAKWKCEPTCTGRSPVLRTVTVSTGRPALISIGAVAGKNLARDHAIGPCTVTSLVPSGKVASTCTSASISGTPVHDVLAGEHPPAGVHQVGHGAPVPGALQQEGRDDRGRLRVVELQSPLTPLPGHIRRDVDEQAFLLVLAEEQTDLLDRPRCSQPHVSHVLPDQSTRGGPESPIDELRTLPARNSP